mmetsp:Transcript_24868/g.77388  ORF Transcript_24868/g.77388 Transcript_24868/m.77388 type:complete len:302 (-) Transcript_24868:187-1092(-)
MLYADKRALETNLKVSLLQIREKELNFYTQNCLAVGTQAALLAGFAYAGLTQVSVPKDKPYLVKLLYLLFTTGAMSFELIAVLNTTLLSMLGPGLALRGPDGSMHKAVDGMMYEYRKAFFTFGLGLIAFHFSALMFGWLLFRTWVAVSITVVILISLRVLWRYVVRIFHKFQLPKDLVISGRFSPEAELAQQQGGVGGSGVDPSDQQTLNRLIEREQQAMAGGASSGAQFPVDPGAPHQTPPSDAEMRARHAQNGSGGGPSSAVGHTNSNAQASASQTQRRPQATESDLQRQGVSSWLKFM